MKINKEIIQKLNPLFQAIVEGKDIQVTSGDGWMDINLYGEGINAFTLIACPESYRIKPEPKYRPFANAEECWEEMQKHEYFGWIKAKDASIPSRFMIINSVRNEEVSITSGIDFTYNELVEHYTFIDRTPFVVKEEE